MNVVLANKDFDTLSCWWKNKLQRLFLFISLVAYYCDILIGSMSNCTELNWIELKLAEDSFTFPIDEIV